jgi:tRNA nucleotidyltransferase/poly(A) polymerase
MRRPSIRGLAPSSLRAAVEVAERLAGAGQRAWLVGGAVRDLALGASPKDVDLATAATPDEIERLFPRTVAVGKSFGTIVVPVGGENVQVTTFRSESGYRDARRPDAVAWGATPEEDSRRRDFTCNALYLDPLSDELLDPQGGLADLERRLLRCVGDPAQRFREDGLRLVRMARLAAANELDIEPATWAGACANAASIVGVSGERLLEELSRVFSRPHAARAMRWLDHSGVLERALPGLERLGVQSERRWAALEALGPVAGVEAGIAVLFDPAAGEGSEAPERALELLELLRPPRALRTTVASSQRLLASLSRVERDPAPSRAARIRLVRDEHWPLAERLARAWRSALGRDTAALDELARFAASLGERDKFPQAWISSQDLERARVPRGPRWGQLLEQAETLQLDGAWRTRDEALAWLAAQAASR